MKNTVPKDLLFESTGIHLFCPIAIAVFFFFFCSGILPGQVTLQSRVPVARRTICRLLIILFKPSVVSANLLYRLASSWSVIETLQVVSLICSLSLNSSLSFSCYFTLPWPQNVPFQLPTLNTHLIPNRSPSNPVDLMSTYQFPGTTLLLTIALALNNS